MAQGTSGQGILEGVGPLPTAADNRHVAGLFFQQALGHGFTVRQRRRKQQGNLADTIERPGAIGGAHEQTLASHPLRRHGNG